MTIGNFNSQLGVRKCSETHYEMTIGNLTPFGELKIYKRNGVGRPPGDRLPGCICWQISIVGAKASKWGDTPSPLPCLPFSLVSSLAPTCRCRLVYSTACVGRVCLRSEWCCMPISWSDTSSQTGDTRRNTHIPTWTEGTRRTPPCTSNDPKRWRFQNKIKIPWQNFGNSV